MTIPQHSPIPDFRVLHEYSLGFSMRFRGLTVGMEHRQPPLPQTHVTSMQFPSILHTPWKENFTRPGQQKRPCGANKKVLDRQPLHVLNEISNVLVGGLNPPL